MRTVHEAPRACRLSHNQVAAIRAAMRLFIEDDLDNGVSPAARQYCDACERHRPAAGFLGYGRHQLCNPCASEYELAHAAGLVATVGSYLRDRRFGETFPDQLNAALGFE